MDEIKKEHNKVFLRFIGIFTLLTAAIIFVGFTNLSVNMKTNFFFLYLILMIGVTLYYRPRLFYYINKIKYYRLVESQEPPIRTKKPIGQNAWFELWLKDEFKVFKDTSNFTCLHRYTQDKTSIPTRQPMIEIMIFIHNPSIGYHSKEVTELIHALEDHYQKESIKYKNYTLLQFKSGDMPIKDVEGLPEIMYEKESGRHITVVNFYYQKDTEKIAYLHSKTYTPSLYYSYAIDLAEKYL